MLSVWYFSSVAENTHRFVQRLDVDSHRIPVTGLSEQADEPYLLIVPTYGNADVPKQVVRFLNDPVNRLWLRGVVGSGNLNFGANFARAADIISERTGVPLIHKFEILGTPADVQIVQEACQTL